MSRIIAGTAGGRRIDVPDGRTTRPTSDRAREALFASVLSELGSLDGVRVLDLFAGSGAIGLEALSRGAAHALLVEADRRAAAVVKRNIAGLRLPGARLVADKAARTVDRGPDGGPYDLIVADPPYALPDEELRSLLEALRGGGWTAPDAFIVIERSARDPEHVWPDGYEGVRVRRYGEAALWYGRVANLHHPSPASGA